MSADPDWKWTGGRPGEITGTMWEQTLDDVHDEWYDGTDAGAQRWRRAEEAAVERMDAEVEPRLRRSRNLDIQRMAEQYGCWALMEDFAHLEAANIPREWTGKVLAAARRSSLELTSSTAQALSGALRGLYVPEDAAKTRSMRETFLALLPEWQGSLDDLAAAAQALSA